MNVLHILDHSVPMVDGYAMRSQRIIHQQMDLGLGVQALTSPLHREKWGASPERFDGVSYTRIPSNHLPGAPFIRELVIVYRIRNAILSLNRQWKIDILHAHSPSLNGAGAWLAAKKINIPFVYEIRAFWEDAAVDQYKFKENSFKYRISKGIETTVVRKSNATTAIAKGLIDDIVKRGVHKAIHHIPNGVDIERFAPVEKNRSLLNRYGLDREQSVILGFIGSFYRFEGLDVLLEAFKSVYRKQKKVYLFLIGGGEDEDFIRKKVSEDQIKNVIMTGRIPHGDIADYYSIMDIMIYPRVSERITELTTPLKPLEAMAMGKCVIGSDVGGIKELIESDEIGILFKASDPEDLAKSINKLILSGRYREMGNAARRFVENKKQWRDIITRYLHVYQSATGYEVNNNTVSN